MYKTNKIYFRIVAEECKLGGYALVKLNGHAVNLGHDTFHINGCKFSIEVNFTFHFVLSYVIINIKNVLLSNI